MENYIKVYTKVLDNPKVGRLDDKTWRIMMELFLIAGDTFDDGKLPDLATLSWLLRRPEKEIRAALSKLEKIGTVSLSGDNATVTNFVKYQNTNQTAYDRVKKWRMKRDSVSDDNADDNGNDNANDNADDNKKDNVNDNAEITYDNGTDKDKDKDILINSLSGDRELDAPAKKAPKAAAKPKPEKHKHGSFGNVLLTDEELEKLHERFIDAEGRIEAFSKKKAAKGYVYKSDYAAILSWADSDAKKDAEKAQTKPEKKRTFADIAADFENQADGDPHPEWDIIDL